MRKRFKCCICKKLFEGFGNNPWPFGEKEEDRCCDQCNDIFVITARLLKISNKHDLEEMVKVIRKEEDL